MTESGVELINRAPAHDELERRSSEYFDALMKSNYERTSRLFAVLMGAQWVFGVVLALTLSPYAWAGRIRTPHVHLLAAVFLGGALSGLPIVLAMRRPDWVGTRHVIACAQMLWSALLIHLTGGRIETHFHVFGSLAFLAFYRDWRVLVPATIVVAGDHFVRGLFWPESVYGVLVPGSWRFLEHAGWVVFEDVILVFSCIRGVQEARLVTQRQAEAELASEREKEKSAALDAALADLQKSQGALVRAEKLAAIGQLAASIGHELRNPLTAVRNAATFISKKLGDPKTSGTASSDPRIGQFLGIIDRELGVAARIISDLLDFARERPPTLRPCPLRPLVDEAISVVPQAEHVKIVNDVPDDLRAPDLDKDQFRQVLVNLVQNAVEAIPSDRAGEVRVAAEGTAAGWKLSVRDNGPGMPESVAARIFEPLFTTKSRGTGLGLAVVANLVRGHGGSIDVKTTEGTGATFTIDLPTRSTEQAA
jgi:signal transduction histidine kinase